MFEKLYICTKFRPDSCYYTTSLYCVHAEPHCKDPVGHRGFTNSCSICNNCIEFNLSFRDELEKIFEDI
jgi:hypothetical protein